MEHVYVLINGSDCWEDMIILLSNEDAINKSINYPNGKVEIFSKNDKSEYTPTYNYYENGELIKNE